jgi:hypothetical protein
MGKYMWKERTEKIITVTAILFGFVGWFLTRRILGAIVVGGIGIIIGFIGLAIENKVGWRRY